MGPLSPVPIQGRNRQAATRSGLQLSFNFNKNLYSITKAAEVTRQILPRLSLQTPCSGGLSQIFASASASGFFFFGGGGEVFTCNFLRLANFCEADDVPCAVTAVEAALEAPARGPRRRDALLFLGGAAEALWLPPPPFPPVLACSPGEDGTNPAPTNAAERPRPPACDASELGSPGRTMLLRTS